MRPQNTDTRWPLTHAVRINSQQVILADDALQEFPQFSDDYCAAVKILKVGV